MAEPGIADPVAVPVVAPAPAPAPVVPDGVPNDDDQYIRVPKAQLEAYGGRFGEVMRDAKAYADAKAGGRFDPGMDKIMDLARQNNMTPEQVYEYITSEGQPQGQQQQYDNQGQPPAGQQPPTALTEDRMTQILDQREEKRDAARQTAEEKAEQKQAFAAETEDVTRILRDDYKYDFTADGQPDGSLSSHAKRMFESALTQTVIDDIPDWYSRDERAEAIRTAGATVTTSSQRQRAKESFIALMSDVRDDAVSRFAQGQERVPAATLDAGPGGAVTKPVTAMSPKEEMAELARRVQARTGKGMDGEPLS